MDPLSRPSGPQRRWVDRQRRRRRSPFLRLVDHSFGLRLPLAVVAAMAALGVVNRFEHCRDQAFARGCPWQDAGGVVGRGVRFAPARNDTLERLCGAGLNSNGWALSGLDLDQIPIPGARWHGVNLAGSTLRAADLRRADLSGATLQGIRWEGTTAWPQPRSLACGGGPGDQQCCSP